MFAALRTLDRPNDSITCAQDDSNDRRASLEAARADAAEREAAEARASLELVEKQRRALQDLMATERKAHAAALGDQVLAYRAASGRHVIHVNVPCAWFKLLPLPLLHTQ